MLPPALLQAPAGAGLHSWPLELCYTPLQREERSRSRHPSGRKAAAVSLQWDWKRLGWEGGALAGLVEQQGAEQEA